MQQAVLSLLVENHFGVLTKVTGLFGRRGYNIKALSVGETQDPALSRITILTDGDSQKLHQVCAQVSKLEEIKKAAVLAHDGVLERELALIKVKPNADDVGDLMQCVSSFSAKSAAAGCCAVIEVSGAPETIDSMIEQLGRFNIVEICRTGSTALELTGSAFS